MHKLRRKNIRFSSLAVILVLAAIIGLQAAGCAASGSKYDHFLFVRHDDIKGQAGGTDTLVMGQVTPKGFKTKDLYSHNNASIGPEFLDVVGGQAYFISLGQLYHMDLRTGRRAVLAQTGPVTDYDRTNKKFITVDSHLQACEYDLRTGAYRQLKAIMDDAGSNHSVTGTEALSPDHRQLAFFTQVASPTLGYPNQLYIADVTNGTCRKVGEPVRFVQPVYSSDIMIGSPLVWLNANEVLLVQTEGKIRWEAATGHTYPESDQIDHLKIIDVRTGAVKEVAAIPGRAGEHSLWLRIQRPGLSDQTVKLWVSGSTKLGYFADDYLVDLKAGKLVASDALGGDFSLRGREQPDCQLYYGSKLLATIPGHVWPQVSPDGKRVLWTGRNAKGDHYPPDLYYYDNQAGLVRSVGPTGLRSEPGNLLWFSSADLKPSKSRIPPGWQPIQKAASFK
jgi:hypothetical protein